MNQSTKWDDIIIGAGYAGLSLGALLSQQSRKVLVLESHSLPGGCAGFYKRGDFHFDVGATTLSGIAEGMPLNLLINKLNLKVINTKLEIPMIIKLSNGLILKRYADFNLWMEELNLKFPGINHEDFWRKLESISTRAWALLGDVWNFPPQSISEAFKLLKPKLLTQADLGLLLLRPLETMLPKEYRSGVLREFIDEQLLISTQTTSHDVPSLMGALGLTYPSDMYYPKGGISSLAIALQDKIIENGGEVRFKAKVETVSDDLIVHTKDETFNTNRIISTIPIWNLSPLNKKLKNWVMPQTISITKSWSAVTLNIAVKFSKPIENLYHQVHLKEPITGAKSTSLFISLSHPEDRSRAPEGWQTVTISTHALPEDFPSERNQIYKEMKGHILDEVTIILKNYFEDIEETKFESVGTPLTFVKYTQRFKGRVGGIPHSVNNLPWNWPKNITHLANFYHMGDTSFPGQGIVGVVQASFNFMNRFHRN